MDRPHSHWPLSQDSISLSYPETPLPGFLVDTASRHPEFIATTLDDTDITYGELNGKVNGFANALHELGVQKGDRVALMLPNAPTYVIAFYAVLKIGAVVVNVNVMALGEELAEFLANSGSRVLITLDIFVQSALKVFKETPLEQIIIHSVFGMEAKLDLETGIPKPLIFNDLVSSHPWEEPPMAATVDDIAVLQYTSGATGTPKAAVLTHRNIVSNMFQINASMPQHAPENGAVICIIPFFHVFGMTVCMNISVFKGYRMVLLPRFDWSSVLSLMELIEKYRPYSFPAVPSLWAALVSHPEAQYFPLSDIWIPSSGGAPLPAWVQENYESLTGKKIMEAYGLSETASTTHINPLEKGGVTGSIGVPLPGTEAKIVDMETGEKACAVGEVGELIVRGPQVMQGYWKDPELTEKVLKGGWLYTGDLARVDENGFFYVVDRRDDLIISRGYNIYPSEVEKVLTRYPGVKQAAVVGIPDDIRGQSITAFVVREKSEITKEELLAHCREHLSDYKIPKAIWFRKQIPLNPAGKPLRRILRTEIPHGDPD